MIKQKSVHCLIFWFPGSSTVIKKNKFYNTVDIIIVKKDKDFSLAV